MSKKKKKPLLSSGFENNPFASLEVEALAPDPETNSQLDQQKTKAPTRRLCRIRLEKKGRGGKKVTVLYDFEPVLETDEMLDLLSELKKSGGCGGTLKDDSLELQGDVRLRTADQLSKKNFNVKGSLK